MGNHKDNHICIDCQNVNRIGICNKCGQPMFNIGNKLRVPKKGKWKPFLKILKERFDR